MGLDRSTNLDLDLIDLDIACVNQLVVLHVDLDRARWLTADEGKLSKHWNLPTVYKM